MKYIVLIPDGAADEPNPALGGKTPLQAADIPNMHRLAKSGTLGLARTTPEEMTAGSDVTNLGILGYEPAEFFTGRAPIEAVALGIPLGPRDWALRCNLVTITEGVMEDFSAGHISTTEARRIIEALNEQLGEAGVEFHPGNQYRHILTLRDRGNLDLSTTPPHDVQEELVDVHMPAGADAPAIRDLMERSKAVCRFHAVNSARIESGKRPATQIWLWGQGRALSLPAFSRRHGVSGVMITAVDLLRGLGRAAGLETPVVQGATGYLDTDYSAKARAALSALENADFVYVHVEAPDEASHEGNAREKIRAIERIDRLVLAPILDGMAGTPMRMLMLPDHATSSIGKNHMDPPVPFVLWGAGVPARGGNAFTEAAAREGGVFVSRASDLTAALFAGSPPDEKARD